MVIKPPSEGDAVAPMTPREMSIERLRCIVKRENIDIQAQVEELRKAQVRVDFLKRSIQQADDSVQDLERVIKLLEATL